MFEDDDEDLGGTRWVLMLTAASIRKQCDFASVTD